MKDVQHQSAQVNTAIAILRLSLLRALGIAANLVQGRTVFRQAQIDLAESAGFVSAIAASGLGIPLGRFDKANNLVHCFTNDVLAFLGEFAHAADKTADLLRAAAALAELEQQYAARLVQLSRRRPLTALAPQPPRQSWPVVDRSII